MGYSSDPTNLTALAVAGVPTMGMAGIPPTAGNVYFVSSLTGSAGGDGTAENPYATIAQAYALCTANRGDIVVCLAGHAETIIAAGGLALSKAGVTVISIGEGNDRATLTFGTSTAATCTISAASNQLLNFIGVCAIDALVSPFVVSAAGCTLDIEWRDGDANTEALRAVLTTAAADRFNLNLTYKGFVAGNGVVNGVRLVGCNGANINVDFYGVASTSIVEFLTTACSDINITGNFYNSGTTNFSKNVVDTVTGSTWTCVGFDGAAGSSFSGGSGAALAGDDVAAVAAAVVVVDANQDAPAADATANTLERDVIGNKTDAAVTAVGTTKSILAYVKGLVTMSTVQAADAASNAFAGDVVGNKTDASIYVPGTTKSLAAYAKGTADLQERVAAKGAAVMVNGDTLFTVAGGPIMVLGLVSECVTANDGTASTLQYSATPTVGAATTVSGASASLASAAAGATVTLAGTALATAALLSANGPNLIANPGTVLVPAGTITAVIAVGSTTGTWRHYMRYKPLAAGVTVS